VSETLRPVGEVPARVASELAELRAENARLLRLLKLTRAEAAPPGPAQAGFFEAPPGPVHAGSPAAEKVAFFGALFAARTDIYAVRWENARTGSAGWLPAVRGGWRRGVPHAEREHLPLTAEVLAAHLSGHVHIGLYPLLDGDRCWWLAADFDGPAALLDALNYVKAARALNVSAGLEISRSGTGAHVWIFFAGPVSAKTARRLGTGLLREAMALRGQMSLASYDRLFPSQDVLPSGGVGNLIAAPLHGKTRRNGATVFLDLSNLEPHEDQWAFLSTLGRMSPCEATRAADRAGQVTVGVAVDRVATPGATKTRPPAPAVIPARLGAGIWIEQAQLTPALLTTLKHAASMPNPLFYERQRRPTPVLHLHPTSFCHTGDADPSAPGGIAAIYRDLVADDARTRQIANDVAEALQRGRHCLVLTQWTAHLAHLVGALQDRGHDPVILRGGMGAKARSAALARLQPQPYGPPLLAVATGPYIGEGFDCPALDTLFLAAPIAFKGRPRPVRRAHPAPSSGQNHRRDSRLPRPAHRSSRRFPGQTRPRLYQPRLPRPAPQLLHTKLRHDWRWAASRFPDG
jgi:hypothetical protein